MLNVHAAPFLPPPMRHSDTQDSLSSVDSDASRESTESSVLADTSDCGSDGGGKDSGCEVADAEPPFRPPEDQLAERIVQQVEFYFSDVNITKDAFLLKHVRRNKEGYVSLKLISSFKRVKHLAKDWRCVAWALNKKSTKLQVNEAGTKLRRLDPLPQYDETTPSRTVVAAHLPHDKPTIEHVAELFSAFGEIALVRILRPGNPVPADARSFIARRPELQSAVCALVEFVKAESARHAVAAKPEWRGHAQGIKVFELITSGSGPQKTQTKQAVRKASTDSGADCASGSEAEDRPGGRSKRFARRSSSSASRSSVELGPWLLQRRLSANKDAAGNPNGDFFRARSNSGAGHLPENVLRLPRGPDGTRGFGPRIPRTLAIAAC